MQTCTVDAPSRMNSAASAPLSTPPMPDSDRPPPKSEAIRLATACTFASAMGLTALEEYPPGVEYPSTQGSGRRDDRLTPITDAMVLMADTPSHPAASAALAGSRMSVMLGVIFAQTGLVAAPLIHPHTSDSNSGSWPMAMPMRRSGMPWGQEKLTSKPLTPTASHRPIISSHAALLHSLERARVSDE